MDRRRALAAMAGTGAVGVGLAAGGRWLRPPTDDAEPPSDAGVVRGTVSYDTSLAAQGRPPDICSERISDDPGIVAIVDPAFGSDWTGVRVPDRYRRALGDRGLAPEHTVIGLTDGDRARAYPLELLTHHEIVNDTFGDPVLVTFCPICRSGVVADRVVNGSPTTFAVSGLLWQPERIRVEAAQQGNRTFGAEPTGGETVGVRSNGNLVMYDLATVSYWSQILGRAICGPRTGDTLPVRPSILTTWAEWQQRHPATELLLPPPASGTYGPDQYAGDTPHGTPTDPATAESETASTGD